MNDFRKNHTTLKFSSLRQQMLFVTKWRLVAKHEDSRQVYTSYQNFSVQLIVEQFRPLTFEKIASRQINSSECIFRDSEI